MVFGFKERPRHFFSDPRPRRGRHVLAPRDPSDPATLPTLRSPGPGGSQCTTASLTRTTRGEEEEKRVARFGHQVPVQRNPGPRECRGGVQTSPLDTVAEIACGITVVDRP